MRPPGRAAASGAGPEADDKTSREAEVRPQGTAHDPTSCCTCRPDRSQPWTPERREGRRRYAEMSGRRIRDLGLRPRALAVPVNPFTDEGRDLDHLPYDWPTEGTVREDREVIER